MTENNSKILLEIPYPNECKYNKKMEYIVERYGDLYVAGAKYIHSYSDGTLSGHLILDKIRI